METRPTSTKGKNEKKLGLGQHSTFAYYRELPQYLTYQALDCSYT